MSTIQTITDEEAQIQVNWLMNIGPREFWHSVKSVEGTLSLDEPAIDKLREIVRIAQQVVDHFESKSSRRLLDPKTCRHLVLTEGFVMDVRSIFCVYCETVMSPETEDWRPEEYIYDIDQNIWIHPSRQHDIEYEERASDEVLEELRKRLCNPLDV